MKKPYEKPMVELLEFEYEDNITASAGEVTKTPGHHGCTVLPNGKPIPPNAVGHTDEDFNLE